MVRQLKLARRKLAARGARDRVTGCLIWTGGQTGAQYGAVWLDGKVMQVHVVSYELAKGPVPKGCVVAHSCDESLCFEPTHLFAKSQRENMVEALQRGRLLVARLSEDDARAVLALKGVEPAAIVATRFGVTRRQVYRIWAGRRWGHLSE